MQIQRIQKCDHVLADKNRGEREKGGGIRTTHNERNECYPEISMPTCAVEQENIISWYKDLC